MRVRTKIALPLAVLLGLTGIGVAFWVSTSFEQAAVDQAAITEDVVLQALFKELEATLEGVDRAIQDTEAQALGQAALFSRLPEVEQAYTLAATGEMEDERSPQSQAARELLRNFISPFQRGYVDAIGAPMNIHFHLPTANSLVRTWRDGYQVTRDGERVDVSDDLSGFRQTVLDINTGNHDPITGIELGKGGLVIRGLMPITGANGAHLGSVEGFFDFVPVIEKSRTSEDLFFSIYMDTELLSIAVAFQDEETYPQLEGRYVELAATDTSLTFDSIPLSFVERAASSQLIERSADVVLAGMPINDYAGNQVGALIAFRDASSVIASLERSKMDAIESGRTLGLLIAVSVFGIMIAIIVGIVAVISRMLKPLGTAGQIADEITAGNLSVAVPELDRRDEIGSLMNSFSSMTASLRKKGETLSTYAQGDLTKPVELTSDRDELGQSIDTLYRNLSEILSEAGNVAKEVSSGSAHIASASQQLATGANQQAASVEQISSSLNLIANQSKENTTVAREATTSANETVKQSEDGVVQIETLTSLMQEITVSSEETQKVVKTIDDIAFQINLLALNANVEAARAGKYGKGFAVVAEEVRNLATRSAQAVEETTKIMEKSISKIGAGATATARTVEQFQLISGRTRQIANLLSQVSEASANQSDAIQEINAGLTQIDEVTQSNSATAEESSSAADELERMTVRLSNIMSGFTVQNGNGNYIEPTSSSSPSLPAQKSALHT